MHVTTIQQNLAALLAGLAGTAAAPSREALPPCRASKQSGAGLVLRLGPGIG